MSPDPTSPTPTQMSLWGASHVSPTHTQDFKKENQIPAISGRKCLDLSKNVGPLGLLEKTLLESPNWAWTKYSLTWRTKATPQGRLIFQLVRLAPPTSGKDSGLLHTPTAKANQMAPDMLRHKGSWGRIWPTPTGMTGGEGVAPSHRDGTHGWNTAAAVNDAQNPTPAQMWPTPRASEYKGVGPLDSKRHKYRLEKGYLDATVQEAEQTTGKLNPSWVETYLMGYPLGWTSLTSPESESESPTEAKDLEESETQSCLKSQPLSGKQF